MNILDRHNKWLGTRFCFACKRVKRQYLATGWAHSILVLFYIGRKQHIKLERKNTPMVTAAAPKLGDWVWHVHHGTLVEQLTESLATRQQYIKNSKGSEIASRLHFMRPVVNPPTGTANKDAIAEAQKMFDSVQKAYDNWQVEKDILNRAAQALSDAKKSTIGATSKAEWETLHKKECFFYCPWNGQTLFPQHKNGIA